MSTQQSQYINQLVAMGFDADRAKIALELCGNVERAIEFLTTNGDLQLDDQSASPMSDEDEQPSSSAPRLRLNERPAGGAAGAAAAAPLANPFADDTTTRPSLSAIPRDAHLIIHENKLRGDTEEQKMQFKERLRLEAAEKQRQEKLEKAKQLRLLREQVKLEKQERSGRLASQQAASAAPPAAQPAAAPAAAAAGECQLQIRLPDGQTIKYSFQATDTLLTVAEHVANMGAAQLGTFSLMTAFPRREFSGDEFASTTLTDAKLFPRGSLIVQLSKDKGKLSKAEGAAGVPDRGPGMLPALGARGIRTRPGGRRADDDDEEEEDDEDTGAAAAAAPAGRRLGSRDDEVGGDSLQLLSAPDSWLLSDASRQANVQADRDGDQVYLVLRPSSDAEFADQSNLHRRDTFRFLRTGLLSVAALDVNNVKTTRTLNFVLRRIGTQLIMEITDETGTRYQVEVMVLTATNVILKLPKNLLPQTAQRAQQSQPLSQ